MTKVLIVMGSDSDLSIMKGAMDALDQLDVAYEVYISSAHRTPEQTATLAKDAEKKGIHVIIAGAGMAAHLPGVLAAYTALPVIGVPIKGGALNGVDALYSIVQMPKGIPVATVAVNGAFNAGILAGQMLSIKDEGVAERLKNFRKNLAVEAQNKNEKLQQLGVDQYLEDK